MKKEFIIPLGNSYASDDVTADAGEPSVRIIEDVVIDAGDERDH